MALDDTDWAILHIPREKLEQEVSKAERELLESAWSASSLQRIRRVFRELRKNTKLEEI